MTTALALTGGGARGAYQAGVLAGIADCATDPVGFGVITGVSAGGINATSLAADRGPFDDATARLREAWYALTVDQVFRSNVSTLASSALRWATKIGTGGVLPVELRGLVDTRPLHRYLSERIDFDGIGANVQSGRLRALALTMTCYSTGCTVTFVEGAEGTPNWRRARRYSKSGRMSVAHVMASAALPVIFPAVEIDGEYFGDGSIRQAAPLAPAIHLGARKILTISARYALSAEERSRPQVSGYPPPGQILGMIMHGVFLDALENDAERLARINRTLALLPSEVPHPDGLRRVEIELLRPSRDLGKMSAGLVGALPRSLRVLARGLGASRTTTPDFLSYLLFERPYVDRLMDLGFEDARAQWSRLERFLEV